MYTLLDVVPQVPACRIMYEGQGAVHADGSDEADLRRWRLKRFADSAHIPNTTTYEKRKRSRAGSDEGVGRSGASTKQDKPPKSTGLEWSNGAGEGASMDEECMQGAKSPQQSGEAGGSHVSREGSDIEDALEAALEAAACGDVGFSSEEEWCRSSDDADADRASGAGVSEKESVEDGCEDGCSFSELEEGSRMRARGSGGGCGGDGTTGKVRRAKTKAHDAKTSAGAGGRKIAAGDDDTAPESFSQVRYSFCMRAVHRKACEKARNPLACCRTCLMPFCSETWSIYCVLQAAGMSVVVLFNRQVVQHWCCRHAHREQRCTKAAAE